MKCIFILILVGWSLQGLAGYKRQSLLNFSQQEVAQSHRSSEQVAKTAAKCLERYYQEHLAFHNKHGFSKFYGNRRYSHSQVKSFLKRRGQVKLLKKMENISCVDLTRRCLAEGFAAAGMKKTWKKIDAFTIANGVGGTAMQLGLQKIGWKVMYWNPTSSKQVMSRWDDNDFQLNGAGASGTKVVRWQSARKNRRGQYIYNPVWGMHVERYNSVQRRNMYYLNYVDDKSTLVGFDDREPEMLRKVPFFVGIAHAGYHVFPGSYGIVTEAHSTRNITARDNLERSPFNPLGPGGGPRWTKTERYRSGLIAVPPGF